MSPLDGNFIDRCKLRLKAGDGGDGTISFRHEKYVPFGGPDGGDGGDGGSIILQVHDGLNTLEKVSSQPHLRAPNGGKGGKSNKTGANGDNIVLEVPPGTVVKNFDTGEQLVDMEDTGGEWILAQGGKGGKGNARFATATNQAPHKATPGKSGEDFTALFELKLVAHVGLIGLPNAGKSTLISSITGAHPRIADYPFTTLQPVLGTITLEDGFGVVVADIPGIIQGAHEGIGLGLDFLRHIERTKMLIYVVEISPHDPNQPGQTLKDLQYEISQYDAEILKRPSLVVLNKADLLEDDDERTLVLQTFHEMCPEVDEADRFVISALNKNGTETIRREIAARYQDLFHQPAEDDESKQIRPTYMDDLSLFEDPSEKE